MEQLTFDHSLVWEMRASGEVSEEALRSNAIPKNVITRSLGPNGSVAVDLEGPFPFRVGDKFLLCSDGLSGQLTDEEMGVLLQVVDIQAAVNAMVDLANLRGGPDNITVVVGEVKNDGLMKSGAAMDTNPSAVAPQFPVAFGIATAIGLLCCVVLLLLGQFPVAFLAAGAAAVAFATGWYKYQSQRVSNDVSGQYGRGPYRKATCKPDAAFSSNLTQVVIELNDWVSENKWKIKSEKIADETRAARAAEQAKNYGDSIRRYVNVIAMTMEEVRKQQDGQAGDSAIEL